MQAAIVKPEDRMKRRSPPWGAIEAFIVASRSESFKAAAASLALSAPAFSRRVQALEFHLGLQLFDRSAPSPLLTAAGVAYLARLQPGYEAIRAATDWMTPAPEARPLRIGLSQSLAMSWLVPRLGRLHAELRDVAVILQTEAQNRDLKGGGIDIDIFHGTAVPEGLAGERLFGFDAFLLAAPGYAPRPQCLQDLQHCRLLEPLRPADYWQQWLLRAGYVGALPGERLRFDNLQLLYEAASQGLGVALGAAPLSDPFIASGRLQKVLDLTIATPGAYYMVALPEVRRQAPVRAVWDWLTAEAGLAGVTGPITARPAKPSQPRAVLAH